MQRLLRWRVVQAVAVLLAFLSQGTWALAGTTGSISGTLLDHSGAPVAGVAVKISSPSQTATSTTDATGHFTFLSLAPDTYTISAEKAGYEPLSYAGVAIFADQHQTLSLQMQPALKTIARTTSTSAGALVRSGTTADVYSVNASTAGKVTGLGGGSGLDNAYSAIATVPGAYVPLGQMGWFQSVYIRGGDFDQVGYEVDGVPVNRSFDNYPSNTQSALGQQEVQVYTGSAPSNAEGQGLAGFINQVVRTGTYPGFASSDLGIGTEAFYHKANVEVGGATPDRRFSYYAGFGGYNQDFRWYDENNGGSVSSTWGSPVDWLVPNGFAGNVGNCAGNTNAANYDVCYAATGNNGLYPSFGPGGYLLGGLNYGANVSTIIDRENVMNFHFALPHKNGTHDDLQLLWQGSHMVTQAYNSVGDMFGSTAAAAAADQNGLSGGGIATPVYFSGWSYSGPLGQQYQPGMTTPYAWPASGLAPGAAVPDNLRDVTQNDVGIVKLQYQRNMGSNAYLRMYGYTSYSDWLLSGVQTRNANFVGPNPDDYELNSHTNGVSATLADQLDSKNLINAQVSYTQAKSLRDNNHQQLNGSKTLAVAVPVSNPSAGICFGASGATPCSSTEGGSPYKITFKKSGTGAAVTALPAGYEYLAVEDGQNATYNAVVPKFTSGSISDEYQPNDRLRLNLGLRYDRFEFDPQNTDIGPGRDFWFNSWNNAMCVSNVPGSKPVSIMSTPAGQAAYQSGSTAANGGCAALNGSGLTYSQAKLTNTNAVASFTVIQPRISGTLTLNPLNVLRFSWGKYDQAPNAAYEQYNTLQQDLPDFLGPTFYSFGRTQPTYAIGPQISYNTDFSWEHQVKGTDVSWKITPFYRTTSNQNEQFYLDQKTAFVSGLNVGAQTSTGVELQLQKGDFAKNGFAALLSYTYTDAKIKFSNLGNGSSILSPINQSIASYNAYTKACATGGSMVGVKQYGEYVCGSASASALASPCFTTAGTPSGCAAGDVANPYYNASSQGFLDPSSSYSPYTIFPGGFQNGYYYSFVSPHVMTLVLNYRHDKWAITPAVQFNSGSHYGFPIATEGVAPDSCTGVLAGSAAGDPRYTAGAVGGSPFDATTCGNTVPMPNPDTGTFDSLGTFVNPSRLNVSTQFTYDISPRITSVLTLANVVDTCFGGSKEAWTNVVGVPRSKVCGFNAGGIPGEIAPVGNVYNPGATVQPIVAHSYGPGFWALPFNAYLDFKIKL